MAIPELVGAKSKTEAGPGFTGATIYMDPKNLIQIAKLAFPKIKTLGLIHSDDENAVAFAEETKSKGASLGITVLTKQVNKSDKVTPVAEELVAKGAEGFITPMDVYYGLRDEEVSKDMRAIYRKYKIPGISSVAGTGKKSSHGSLLYIAPEFSIIGELTGKQVVKILKDGAKPETLPILHQEKLTIQVDLDMLKLLGLELPNQILQMATPLK